MSLSRAIYRCSPSKPRIVIAMAMMTALISSVARGEVATTLPQLNEFIAQVAAHDGFSASTLRTMFDQVVLRPEIIDAITRPAEAKPWFEYRAIFLTPTRIEGGVAFWRAHQDALSVAEKRYGVDPAVIVAILGVETRYGAKTGNYRVIDALTTLAFQYPKRASFFRDQLEAYLVLVRSEGIDPLVPKGSYAGAMGLPQFMPTSFRDFAVVLNGDGHRDLWNDPWDAIGSVANYLYQHNWQPRSPVAVPIATNTTVDPTPLSEGNIDQRPRYPLSRLRTVGIQPSEPIAGNPTAALLRFEGPTSPEYWLCFENFYAITRYNHSPLYAMAVHQLAREIAAGMGRDPY